MKPAPFDYYAPETLPEALTLKAQHGDDAKLLAGGQSLIPVLNFRLARPQALVDLNKIEQLAWIREAPNGGVSVGGMTRQRQLERAPLVAERLPLLAAAMVHVAHPQIRNRGTVGGSLAHGDPAAELPVLAVALGARFRLVSTGGERWVAAADFYQALFATALKADEILVEIELPAMARQAGWAFHEVARRHGDFAQVGVAATLELDAAGLCRRAKLVLLSVGDVPMVASRAAALLVDQPLNEAAIQAAAHLAADQEIEPGGDIHASEPYKRHLAAVLVRRALAEAGQRASRAMAGGEAGGDRE